MRNLRNTANKPKANEIKKWCDFCDTCQEKEKEKEKDKDQDKTKNMILQTNNLYISTVIVITLTRRDDLLKFKIKEGIFTANTRNQQQNWSPCN